MGELVITENVTVAGVVVPNINGGFGEGKKSMLAKYIAEIHGKQLKHVNETINDNRHRFKDNVDIIDVKNNNEFVVALTDHNIFTKMQIGKAVNIYLLSERGYAKLIKIFNDDKSWDLYDQLLDEYFDLRDANVVPINQAPSTELQLLQGMVNQMIMQENQLKEIENKMTETKDKVTHLETEFNKETVAEGYVTNDNIARNLSIYSTKDKPHFGFVDAVARELRIYNTNIGYKDEYINVIRTTNHGGSVGMSVYYSSKSVEMMMEYVLGSFKPIAKTYVKGKKKGEFNESAFELGGKNYKFNKITYDKYNG